MKTSGKHWMVSPYSTSTDQNSMAVMWLTTSRCRFLTRLIFILLLGSGSFTESAEGAEDALRAAQEVKAIPTRRHKAVLDRFRQAVYEFADKMLRKPGGAKAVGIFINDKVDSDFSEFSPDNKLFARAVGFKSVKAAMNDILPDYIKDRSPDEQRMMDEYRLFIKEAETNPAFKNAQKSLAFEDLFDAMRVGDEKRWKAALAVGPDLNGRHSVSGFSPLHYAAVIGDTDSIKELFKAGANLNQTITGKGASEPRPALEGFTALHIAALTGRETVAQVLIEQGADKNPKDDKGYTPLGRAILHKKLEVAAVLRAAGAKETPDIAPPQDPKKSSLGQDKETETKTALKNAPNTVAFEALFKAIERGATDDARSALAAGADVNGRHPVSGFCPLHYATGQGREDIVEALCKAGANLNQIVTGKGASDPRKSLEGYTALHLAVVRKNAEITRLLIKNGADVNIKADNGWTPLHIAKNSARNEEAVAILKAAGAKE